MTEEEDGAAYYPLQNSGELVMLSIFIDQIMGLQNKIETL